MGACLTQVEIEGLLADKLPAEEKDRAVCQPDAVYKCKRELYTFVDTLSSIPFLEVLIPQFSQRFRLKMQISFDG